MTTEQEYKNEIDSLNRKLKDRDSLIEALKFQNNLSMKIMRKHKLISDEDWKDYEKRHGVIK